MKIQCFGAFKISKQTRTRDGLGKFTCDNHGLLYILELYTTGRALFWRMIYYLAHLTTVMTVRETDNRVTMAIT